MPDNSLPTSSHSSHSEATWQIDCTVLDILIAIDDESGNTISKRPYLIAVVDDKGYIRGAYLVTEPIDSTALEEFMRRMIALREGDLGHQLPKKIWTDSGEEFRNQVFLEKHDIKLVSSSPSYPRGQGKVERMFHDLNQNLPSAVTSIAVTQPRPEPPVLRWEEFRTAFDDFMRQYNGRQLRRGDEADIDAEA